MMPSGITVGARLVMAAVVAPAMALDAGALEAIIAKEADAEEHSGLERQRR